MKTILRIGALLVISALASSCVGAFAGADLFNSRATLRREETTMIAHCGSCHDQYLGANELDYKHKGKPPRPSVSRSMEDQWTIYNHGAEPLLASHLGDQVVKWLDETLKKPTHAAVVVPEPERAALLNYLACQQFYRSPFHCGR